MNYFVQMIKDKINQSTQLINYNKLIDYKVMKERMSRWVMKSVHVEVILQNLVTTKLEMIIGAGETE